MLVGGGGCAIPYIESATALFDDLRLINEKRRCRDG